MLNLNLLHEGINIRLDDTFDLLQQEVMMGVDAREMDAPRVNSTEHNRIII